MSFRCFGGGPATLRLGYRSWPSNLCNRPQFQLETYQHGRRRSSLWAITYEFLLRRWPVFVCRGFVCVRLPLPADHYIHVCFAISVQLVGFVDDGSATPSKPGKRAVPPSALREDFFCRLAVEPNAKPDVGSGALCCRLRRRSACATVPCQCSHHCVLVKSWCAL